MTLNLKLINCYHNIKITKLYEVHQTGIQYFNTNRFFLNIIQKFIN